MFQYRVFTCTLTALQCALVGVWLGTTPASAQGVVDVFQVSRIPVDATANDAVAARRQALLEGQVAGLQRLLRRLTSASEHASLPRVGTGAIERYVVNFEISNEEVSSNRYLAQLTVAYEPGAVRELLQSEDLSFAETTSVPVLVLPVYEVAPAARLWPEGNPWWQAWADNMDPERLLRLVLPLGDLEDMAGVSLAQVQADDEPAMIALAQRYGSSDLLIVTATPSGGPPGSTDGTAAAPAELRIAMRRIGKVEQVNPPEVVRGQPGQTVDELMAVAVIGLQDTLDERWKSANLLRFDQAGTMVLDVPIDQLSDWVEINRGLEGLPEVSQVEIASFARDNVRAAISFIGDRFRLEQAFARLGLALSREGEAWLLRPTEGDPSPDDLPSGTSNSFSPAPPSTSPTF